MIKELQKEIDVLNLKNFKIVYCGSSEEKKYYSMDFLDQRCDIKNLSKANIKKVEENTYNNGNFVFSKSEFISACAFELPKNDAIFIIDCNARKNNVHDYMTHFDIYGACVITKDKQIYPVLVTSKAPFITRVMSPTLAYSSAFYNKISRNIDNGKTKDYYRGNEFCDIFKSDPIAYKLISRNDTYNEAIVWGYTFTIAGIDFIGQNRGEYSKCKRHVFLDKKEISEKVFLSKMSKFFGGKIKNIGASKFVNIEENFQNLSMFLNYTPPIKKAKNDAFLKIDLPKIPYKKSENSLKAFIQKIDKNLCVLRVFTKNDIKKEMEEDFKIFFDKKGAYPYKRNDNGEYFKSSIKTFNEWTFSIEDFTKENVEGTCIEFVEELLDKIPKDKFSAFFCFIMGNPIIEQLYKSEMKSLILNSLTSVPDLKKTISSFGKINAKEKSLLKKLGINKHQFLKIVDVITLKHFNLQDLKLVLNPQNGGGEYVYSYPNIFIDISSIDDNTFDTILQSFVNNTKRKMYYETNFRRIVQYLCAVKMNFGLQAVVKFCKEDYLNFLAPNDFYFIDTMNMISHLKESSTEIIKHITPFFNKDNFDADLISVHDLLVEYISINANKENEQKLQKRIKMLSPFLFKDETFAVILPKNSADFVSEGSKLHHCVGSYIERVADGFTNILFIRKTDDLDTPFFTVEITNDKTIQQVHGMCNRNADTEPGLTEFVKKWSKEKKLKLNNIDKVR